MKTWTLPTLAALAVGFAAGCELRDASLGRPAEPVAAHASRPDAEAGATREGSLASGLKAYFEIHRWALAAAKRIKA